MIDWLFYGSVLLLGVSCVLWLIDTLHEWMDEMERQDPVYRDDSIYDETK